MDNRETSCRNRHYPQGGRKKRKRPSAYGDSRNRRDAGKRKNGNKAAWNHEKRERSKGLSTVKMTNAFQVRIRLSYRDLVYLPAEKKGHPDMHNASETELIELLKDTIEDLKKENESLKEEKAGFLAQIQELQQTTVNLNETVEYLKRKLFGRSREKQEDPDQMKFDFFNEAEAEADPSVPEPTEEEVIEVHRGDDDAEEIQQRHEEGDDLLVPEPEERSLKRGEQEEERGADEEVEADLRHVPVLVVRPGVEQREGAAPGEPCEEVRQGSPREERNARAVLHEHEREHDGQEDGDEVLRAHVLSDVDVEGDQADVVDARCRQPADETVLSLGRKLHAITSVPGCLGQPSI